MATPTTTSGGTSTISLVTTVTRETMESHRGYITYDDICRAFNLPLGCLIQDKRGSDVFYEDARLTVTWQKTTRG